MAKKRPHPDRPGASAASEGRRAQRAARRRRPLTAALAVVAATTTALGLATGERWWAIGGVFAAGAAWWGRPSPDPYRWLRGAEGEVATAQLLARLPRRFVVLHDRRQPGGRGNVDHIVVGPSGVWVVDSKTRRAGLQIDRGHVWAGRYAIDPAPVAGQAARLEARLGVPVTPVIAVHGRGLRRRGKKVAGVRILPARHLRRHLRCHLRWRLRRGRRLPPAEVVVLAARATQLFPPC